MASLQTEYCVEIRVPLLSGKFGFGSGYTLGRAWVLTAHHVLFPKNAQERTELFDASKSIKITWWNEAYDEIAHAADVPRTAIKWFSEKHDIALIRCQPWYEDAPQPWTVLPPKPWTVLHRGRPRVNAQCECGGYLSNLQNEHGGQRRKTPRGRVGRFSSEEIKADVNGLNVQMDDDALWAGFSGSPVFCDHHLTAVVREVNTGEGGGGLTISFLAPALSAAGDQPDQGRLRDVPDFLVPPAREESWERLFPAITARLEQERELRRSLKQHCGFEALPGSQPNAKEIASALYQLPEIEFAACLVKALAQMKQDGNRGGVMALDFLARAWLNLLAADEGALPDVAAFKEDATAAPLRLEIVEPLQVDLESHAAEAEQRVPQLQLMGSSLRSPLDLTPLHNTGFDETGAHAAKDARYGLALKTQPGLEAFDAEDVKDELERFATRAETGLSSPPERADEEAWGEAISFQLTLASLEARGSWYARVPPPAQESDDKDMRRLHALCPELVMFEVVERDEQSRRLLMSSLHRVIYVAQQFLAATKLPD